MSACPESKSPPRAITTLENQESQSENREPRTSIEPPYYHMMYP